MRVPLTRTRRESITSFVGFGRSLDSLGEVHRVDGTGAPGQIKLACIDGGKAVVLLTVLPDLPLAHWYPALAFRTSRAGWFTLITAHYAVHGGAIGTIAMQAQRPAECARDLG